MLNTGSKSLCLLLYRPGDKRAPVDLVHNKREYLSSSRGHHRLDKTGSQENYNNATQQNILSMH